MGLTLTPRLGVTPQLDTPGFFGGDSGISYEELQARKRIARELMGGNGQIRTVGEGINSAASSIAGALMKRRADKEEGKQRDSFNEAFNSVVPGMFGGSAPLTGTASTKTPDASAPVTPTPSNAEFVEAMMPHALRVSEQTGIDPRVVIAQAALETGWGKSAPGNNYFGIKSHGRKGGNTLQTTEFSNGRQIGVKDSFRAYSGMGESADDYAAFLKANPRYAPMLGSPDMEGQINALAESGYATDPQYGAKIRSIAAGIPMDGSLTARASTQSAPAGIRTAQAGGIDPTIIQQLAQLAGSPYANDGQRAIVQALLGQQLQAMQPREPTALMQNYEYARSLGMSDAEARAWVKGGVNIDMGNDGPNIGTIPQGYAAVVDETNPAGYRMVPIPGGPEDTAEADANAAEQKTVSAQLVLDEIGIAKELISKQSLFSPATGITGKLASGIDSTRAGKLKNRFETIKANLGFDKLQAMRDASPTGGALGQVSEFENRLLQAVMGSLEQAQSGPDLLYNLNRLEAIYGAVINGIPTDEDGVNRKMTDEEAQDLYRQVIMENEAPDNLEGIPDDDREFLKSLGIE